MSTFPSFFPASKAPRRPCEKNCSTVAKRKLFQPESTSWHPRLSPDTLGRWFVRFCRPKSAFFSCTQHLKLIRFILRARFQNMTAGPFFSGILNTMNGPDNETYIKTHVVRGQVEANVDFESRCMFQPEHKYKACSV